MLQLKHLFDNRALATTLLGHWDWDQSRPEALDRFRISANAVYPFFSSGGALCFLRFAPVEEKDPAETQAELAFLKWLADGGVAVALPVPARDGRTLVVADTPWGRYAAAVFAGAPGSRMDWLSDCMPFMEGYGRALARLHRRSAALPAPTGRPDWRQRLDWCEAVLQAHHCPAEALHEVALLREWLAALPTTPDTYGMIHGDYELDNVLFDEAAGVYTVIDFDDCTMHWYEMDVCQTLDNLAEELPEEQQAVAAAAFLAGYRAEWPLADGWEGRQAGFRRYGALLGYTRIVHSLAGAPDDRPDWMVGLIGHLNVLKEERAAVFSQPLPPG